MKNKLIFALLFIVFLVGIVLGWYIRSQTFNPRAAFPNYLGRIFGFLIQTGEKEDDDLLYHNVGIEDFIVNGSTKTKVSVEGIVDKIFHEPDGDYHVIVRPQNVPGLYLVTEFIPEINLPLPKEGDRVSIWGIVRFDELHNWWELHPVIGWKKL